MKLTQSSKALCAHLAKDTGRQGLDDLSCLLKNGKTSKEQFALMLHLILPFVRSKNGESKRERKVTKRQSCVL